jgi:outer membrane immunogenic protein
MRIIASIVTCGFASIVAGSVHAADLPFKAPPPAPVIVGWSGFYVGLNAGGGIAVNSNTQSATFTSTALGMNGLLTGSTNSLALPGWVLGGQIGYNWQVSPRVVLGLEADGQWTSEKGSTTNSTPPVAFPAFFGAGGNGFGYTLVTQQKLTDIATARARGGVLIRDSLWYLTGGLAWGTVQDSYAFSGAANPVLFPAALQPGPFLPSSGSFSTSKWGWTIGAGVESRLGGGWSVKAEYLYVDLGTVGDTLPIAINPAFGAPFNNGGSASATSSSHVTDNIMRVGLNYKFY